MSPEKLPNYEQKVLLDRLNHNSKLYILSSLLYATTAAADSNWVTFCKHLLTPVGGEGVRILIASVHIDPVA